MTEKQKVAISQHVRAKMDENYEQLERVQVEISKRIEAEFRSELQGIRAENDKLRKECTEFINEAKQVLASVTTSTVLRVQTQTGPKGSIVREHIGVIESNFHPTHGTFNFIDANAYGGKPFTIGFSCLLSIEIVKEESNDD